MNKLFSPSVQQMLAVGILASIIVGAGEYMLHYLPGGPGGEISMLEKVPLGRASKGHFFAVAGAPLYFMGYYGMKTIFSKSSPILSKLLYVLGVLAFFVGGIWISSRYFAAEVLQRSLGTADHDFYLASYEVHYQSLVWALRIIISLLSVTYIVIILKNNLGIPKWVAIFNPIVLLAITISTLAWCMPIGEHLAPIAMNVTHFIFFGIMLYYSTKNKTKLI
ncbi:hypothetical protein N9L92_00075 [Saprospiraceae bacterium]|nr:hypothetical protein [Saprospiraceae bacterium]